MKIYTITKWINDDSEAGTQEMDIGYFENENDRDNAFKALCKRYNCDFGESCSHRGTVNGEIFGFRKNDFETDNYDEFMCFYVNDCWPDPKEVYGLNDSAAK